MELTPENKAVIDAKTHFELLLHWRYAPIGNKWLQGDTGQYWGVRMFALRDADCGQAVVDSKTVTWKIWDDAQPK